MDLLVKLFFSAIAIAASTLLFWSRYRYTQSKSVFAVVKQVQVLRSHVNPAWKVNLAYEVNGRAYLCDVMLSSYDWPGGVFESQKILIRAHKKSPQKCFIETGNSRPVSAFIRYIVLGLSAFALIVIWAP